MYWKVGRGSNIVETEQWKGCYIRENRRGNQEWTCLCLSLDFSTGCRSSGLHLHLQVVSFQINMTQTFWHLLRPIYLDVWHTIWWSTMSNAFCKSIITIPVNKPLNDCNLMWPIRWIGQVWVWKELLKPDWNEYNKLIDQIRLQFYQEFQKWYIEC